MANDNIYDVLLKIGSGHFDVAVEQLNRYRNYANAVSGVPGNVTANTPPESHGAVPVASNNSTFYRD